MGQLHILPSFSEKISGKLRWATWFSLPYTLYLIRHWPQIKSLKDSLNNINKPLTQLPREHSSPFLKGPILNEVHLAYSRVLIQFLPSILTCDFIWEFPYFSGTNTSRISSCLCVQIKRFCRTKETKLAYLRETIICFIPIHMIRSTTQLFQDVVEAFAKL